MDLTVTVKRWWFSKEMWNYIAGLALVIMPIVANMIGDLGLSPLMLLIWTVSINVITYTAGMILKTTSKSIVANKAVVEDAKAVVADPTNPASETTVKVSA